MNINTNQNQAAIEKFEGGYLIDHPDAALLNLHGIGIFELDRIAQAAIDHGHSREYVDAVLNSEIFGGRVEDYLTTTDDEGSGSGGAAGACSDTPSTTTPQPSPELVADDPDDPLNFLSPGM